MKKKQKFCIFSIVFCFVLRFVLAFMYVAWANEQAQAEVVQNLSTPRGEAASPARGGEASNSKGVTVTNRKGQGGENQRGFLH